MNNGSNNGGEVLCFDAGAFDGSSSASPLGNRIAADAETITNPAALMSTRAAGIVVKVVLKFDRWLTVSGRDCL